MNCCFLLPHSIGMVRFQASQVPPPPEPSYRLGWEGILPPSSSILGRLHGSKVTRGGGGEEAYLNVCRKPRALWTLVQSLKHSPTC